MKYKIIRIPQKIKTFIFLVYIQKNYFIFKKYTIYTSSIYKGGKKEKNKI